MELTEEGSDPPPGSSKHSGELARSVALAAGFHLGLLVLFSSIGLKQIPREGDWFEVTPKPSVSEQTPPARFDLKFGTKASKQNQRSYGMPPTMWITTNQPLWSPLVHSLNRNPQTAPADSAFLLPAFTASLTLDEMDALGQESEPNNSGSIGSEGSLLPGDLDSLDLFLDSSVSMTRDRERLIDFLGARYGGVRPVLIENCAINSPTCKVVRTFKAYSHQKEKSKFHFVCDLRDQINSRGIRSLRQVLMNPDSPKQLHVISIRNPPGDLLQQLIDDSGGTFTLIN